MLLPSFRVPLTSRPQGGGGAAASCASSSRQIPLRDKLGRGPAGAKRRTVAARVADVSEADFEAQVLQSSTPVLVDFWANWCGPCKLMHPLMAWAEKEYEGKVKVVKIEHDSNPKLIEKYKVYGLPCFILFKDGADISGSKKEGAVNQKMLTQYLQKFELLE